MLFCLLYVLLTVVNAHELVPVDKAGFCETVDGEVGTCIEIPDCDIIYENVDIFPSPIPKTIKDYLLLSHCGWSGKIPMVCCPNKQVRSANYMDLSNHKNAYLLPKDVCGIHPLNYDRLASYRGSEAEINEFPFMVLLVYDSAKARFKCGGSIITERYILTAGHCITPELKKARLGEYIISTPKDCGFQLWSNRYYCAPSIREFGIERITRHEMYLPRRFISDIALIRLDGSINFTEENVKPICLPLYNNLRSINLNSKILTAIGFGMTERMRQSDVLLKVQVKIVDNMECNKKYRSRRKLSFLNDNKLCAGVGGRDSCNGDSGGPLTYISDWDGEQRYLQYGIVSYGPFTCGTNVPGVYTRVSKYMKWILDNLKP